MASTDNSATGVRAKHAVLIFFVSMAGLLLEVGYTRIISYKLWYYYTYLVIGLALLGVGSGAIFVVVIRRLREAATDAVIAGCGMVGAVAIAVGYLVVARVPVDTVQIWEYGTRASYKNVATVGLISFVIFASFLPFGVIVATLLGRGSERIGRLYLADLVGAGLGCVAAIPLIVWFGPPRVLMIAALVFGLSALVTLGASGPVVRVIALVIVVILVAPVADVFHVPDVRPEITKGNNTHTAYSAWGPVFRVDVVPTGPNTDLLLHDGTLGSEMNRYDDNPATLGRYAKDPRAIPFKTLPKPPAHELIIGSAAGNEILASLWFHARDIDAVELNPVTVSLLTKHFADYSGHLGQQPGVHLHNADGRNFLARSKKKYNLIWYVAPDSYAVSNAASSGAFVLSESYLYTWENIRESLKHLAPGGIMVVQFGELNFQSEPNRTARYVMTARKAFEESGTKDPGAHMMVAVFSTNTGDLSTIMLKRSAFTPADVQRYQAAVPGLPHVTNAYAPGAQNPKGLIPTLAGSTDQVAAAAAKAYPHSISAVSDDQPFFWHFASFTSVVQHIFKPLNALNPEDVIGERVLLLLLFLAALYAAIFLFVPFMFVRREWRELPSKLLSGAYFAALGLGFIFFEITMIQRLVRFLGYPTYSLTVTLAAILVFTGAGALLSNRFVGRADRIVVPVYAVLVVLTLVYVFALNQITDSLLTSALGVRIALTVVLLAPLGVCLGMFMPLGLRIVSELSPHATEYVAWGWAVNGFFSVIGSVLTTILAMTFGFRVVQLLALGLYAIAAVALWRLQRVGADAREAAGLSAERIA